MDSNIVLTAPAAGLSAALLQEPGAFLWWYVDLLDAEGSGAVLIWSYGLPFLPGLREAGRRGTDNRPLTWPSLNVVVYERGVPSFYALQRLAPGDVQWEGGEEWRFGASRIAVHRRHDRLELRAELDVELPGGERCQGQISLEGIARKEGVGEHSKQALPIHDWCPETGPAHGRLDLRVNDRPLVVEGRGYHDRNGGAVPFWDLDIRRWLWGRMPFAHEELIFFTLWRHDTALPPETHLLRIDEGGNTVLVDDVEVNLTGDSVTWTGLRVPRVIELAWSGGTLIVERHALVDLGPFYFRVMAQARRGDETTLGFAEGIVPRRVDRALERPFVRMRVHDATGANSPYLPFFAGAREGRWSRLFRSLRPQGDAIEVRDA